jgi:ankyrin repeat protein
MAAAKGQVALADALLAAGADVNLANVRGVTPLMGAGYSANAELTRKLIAGGAKIEPVDLVKNNAATYAAASGCVGCLQALMAAGTQVNARLDNNLTLLMWAAAYGHMAAVRELLARGADGSLRDARDKSAADMAREANHQAVAELLEPTN